MSRVEPVGLSSWYVCEAVKLVAPPATLTDCALPSPQFTEMVRPAVIALSKWPVSVTDEPSLTAPARSRVCSTAGVVVGGPPPPVVPKSCASGDEHATEPGWAIALNTESTKFPTLAPMDLPKSQLNA